MRHSWRIEEREYARQEARRGRRHAYEHLDPTRTALVVVDLVPYFFADNPYAAGVLEPVNHLAAALRAAGGTVAWVVPAPDPPSPAYDQFFGPDVAARLRTSGEAGLHPDLMTSPDDLYVTKTARSAFFPGRCDLHARLVDLGVDTVLMAGTVTNVCVESSVRDASTLGYRVVLVADACAAVRDTDHNATLHTVYRTFGDVRPTDEVLDLIGRG